MWMDGQMDGSMDGSMDGYGWIWMDIWMGIWIDRWIDNFSMGVQLFLMGECVDEWQYARQFYRLNAVYLCSCLIRWKLSYHIALSLSFGHFHLSYHIIQKTYCLSKCFTIHFRIINICFCIIYQLCFSSFWYKVFNPDVINYNYHIISSIIYLYSFKDNGMF